MSVDTFVQNCSSGDLTLLKESLEGKEILTEEESEILRVMKELEGELNGRFV